MLKFINFASNPLEETIVFSFRTDQTSAMLVYAHDHLYNFVQIHLSDDNQLSLTLNNNRTVHRCTIVAKAGNRMLSI